MNPRGPCLREEALRGFPGREQEWRGSVTGFRSPGSLRATTQPASDSGIICLGHTLAPCSAPTVTSCPPTFPDLSRNRLLPFRGVSRGSRHYANLVDWSFASLTQRHSTVRSTQHPRGPSIWASYNKRPKSFGSRPETLCHHPAKKFRKMQERQWVSISTLFRATR